LTLLGMEVKGIERWARIAERRRGRAPRGPQAPERRPPLTDPRHDRRGRATSRIVCGATNIAAGQRSRWPCPAPSLPGGRHIDGDREMGGRQQRHALLRRRAQPDL
jgi:hypothetical protein